MENISNKQEGGRYRVSRSFMFAPHTRCDGSFFYDSINVTRAISNANPKDVSDCVNWTPSRVLCGEQCASPIYISLLTEDYSLSDIPFPSLPLGDHSRLSSHCRIFQC